MPLLQPLADNGGATKTMALSSNSPAIGKGTTTGTPATDQRELKQKTPPDISAYETQP